MPRYHGSHQAVPVHLVFALLLLLPFRTSSYHDDRTCSPPVGHVVVEPDAHVAVGAVLPVHVAGAGVYGCGPVAAEGVVVYEALRWAVDVLNTNSGLVSDAEGAATAGGSLVPGVKIGLQVYDSCGHHATAVEHLTTLFPVLRSGSTACDLDTSNSTLTIGVVDMSDAVSQPKVSEAMHDFMIPRIELSMMTLVPPERMAQVLLKAAQDLQWSNVVLIHEEDAYSISVTKQLTHGALAGGGVCISSIYTIPAFETVQSHHRDLRPLRSIMRSATDGLAQGTAVIVITGGEGAHARGVLQIMAELPDVVTGLQWLFSWIPPAAALGNLGSILATSKIYSIAPYPDRLIQFEEYWSTLSQQTSKPNPENRWFTEYMMDKKGCRTSKDNSNNRNLPLCSNGDIREGPLDVLLRTSTAVPALTSVFTFAAAFHKAWEGKCQGRPGLCAELRSMSRREFATQFLDPVEFLIGGDNDVEDDSGRSPRGVANNEGEKLEGSRLALTLYGFEKESGLSYKQLLVYDRQGSRVLDHTFKSQPSQCYGSECRGCVRPRQSRLEDRFDNLHSENLHPDTAATSQPEADVVLPLLLPLHRPGPSPLDCGSSLDHDAVLALEAALWAVDRINEDRGVLGGAVLGVEVLDSCGSPLLATQRMVDFLVREDLPVTSAMVVVSAASGAETLAANQVLRPLNITTISTLDITSHLSHDDTFTNHHILQVAPPATNQIHAALKTFDHFGWRFVTAVYEEVHNKKFKIFASLAKKNDICIAAEIPIQSPEDMMDKDVDSLLQTILEAKSRGSRVVALWVGEVAARRLLTGLGRFLEAKVLSPGDLVLMGFGPWMEKVEVIHGLENVALGSMLYKPEQGDIPEFSAYIRHLHDGTNFRNPWFEELRLQDTIQKQMMNVNVREKISSGSASMHGSNNMIQAVISVATGLASLRNQFCQVEFGVCTNMIEQVHLQKLAGEGILAAEAPRLDHPGQLFQFNKDGYGEVAMDVYNFKKQNMTNAAYLQKVGSYDGQLHITEDIVTYTSPNSSAVPMHSIASTCHRDCFLCQSTSNSFLEIAPSSQDLYVAVAMAVHESSENPLACGALKPTRGFQNLESVLWALDKVNSERGLDLGLIVFDTCGSKEKSTMDLSNFLTGNLKSSLPPPEDVVGFLVDDGNVDVTRSLVDLTSVSGATAVVSSAMDDGVGDGKKYPRLLKMGMPNRLLATSLVGVLRHFHWNYVSVVYADGDESVRDSEVFQEFKKQAGVNSIQLALIEKVGQDEDMTSAMSIIAHRLKIKHNTGARVVLLLMPAHLVERLLAAVKQLQNEGRVRQGDFIWVTRDSLEPFQTFPELSVGSLVVKSGSGSVDEFREYFTRLSLKNDTRNPWLKEYWEQVFNCRGQTCTDGGYDDLRQIGFIQDKTVANTANGFLALANGLDGLKRRLCPGPGECLALRNRAVIRERLFHFVKEEKFLGAEGKLVQFGDENYAQRKLDVYNFRDIGGNAQAFVAVGQFDEARGLSLNSSRTRGQDMHGRAVPLSEVLSACNDSEACKKPETGPLTTAQHFMKIPSNQEFVIAAMMPVHRPGSNFFTCSNVIEESAFQNLVALSYALESVNRNVTVLPEIKLGALVFDHCGRRQKAEEQIFSFIASDGSLPFAGAKLSSRAVVAALTDDAAVAEDLSPLFESMLVPQVASPARMSSSHHRELIRHQDKRRLDIEAQVVADLLNGFDWKFVNVIHEDSKSGRNLFWSFIEAAKTRKICVAESLLVKQEMDAADLMNVIENGIESESRVVVLLFEDPLLSKVLEAASKAPLFEEFIWIGLESNGHGRNSSCAVQDKDVDLFLVRPETTEIPGFEHYYSNFNLSYHHSIPSSWFQEFWQHRFQCHLQTGSFQLKQYANQCTGAESLHQGPFVQDPFVHHTVNAVTAIAESLHDYLRRYCLHGDAARNLDDCGEGSRQVFWREIRKLMKAPPQNCVDGDCGPLKMSARYEVHQLQRMKRCHAYQQVGVWRDDRLTLKLPRLAFTSGVKRESVCRQNCQKCFDQLTMEPQELLAPKPSLYVNFRTLWGIVISALSVLGVLLVVICATYFLISFQITVGTTVLGYMILFGLLLLYALNFAFVLSPSEGTCGIRRFILGLAYATVFSGMLVKVMNIWRTTSCYQFHDSYGAVTVTSPATLLVMAVGLVVIQVVLSAAWLILIPPTTGMLDGEWRCHPATTFEDELVISLVYVMLMLALTMLFAALTWRSVDNNRESRWILTCCVLIALVWVAWTVVSTQVLHQYRDLTISVANLTCATVVMLCMYLRKVYIFNKLTKDQEVENEVQQSKVSMPNMYGTLTREPPTAMHLSYPGPRVAKSYSSDRTTTTTCSRAALIGQVSDDAASDSSSSGSAQVQAADLYPMDMYDGGSQFQPPSSLTLTSRTLEDTLCARM